MRDGGGWGCGQDLHAHMLHQQQVPYCNASPFFLRENASGSFIDQPLMLNSKLPVLSCMSIFVKIANY